MQKGKRFCFLFALTITAGIHLRHYHETSIYVEEILELCLVNIMDYPKNKVKFGARFY